MIVRTALILGLLIVLALPSPSQEAADPARKDGAATGALQADERALIERVIRDNIGWALTKNRPLAESTMAHDESLFIFNPASEPTVGWSALVKNFDFWLDPRFKATKCEIWDVRIGVSRSGEAAWWSCMLNDLAEWDGKPTGWRDTRWTGVMEKRDGRWVIVQMHFSFAADKVAARVKAELEARQGAAESLKPAGPYLGLKPPGDRAELFAPGVVSTGSFEHSSPVFTPDLKEIYWSTQIEDENGNDTARPILFMKEIDGVWSKPEVPAFAAAFACAESPFIAPGGKTLFFHAGQTLRSEKTWLYRVDRTGDGWSAAVKLGAPLNALRMNVEPTVAKDGTVYFAGDYRGDVGLYYSELVGGRYQKPVPMDGRFNSLQTDWTPYVAPDESYFIFGSFRPGGSGSGDLYISFKQDDGSWGAVVNMGDKVNTEANERFPNVTPDGRYLFFNSTRKIPGAAENAPGNGKGDVYWIDAKIIRELRRTASDHH